MTLTQIEICLTVRPRPLHSRNSHAWPARTPPVARPPVTYDPEADASYVKVRDAPVSSTDNLNDLYGVDLDPTATPSGSKCSRPQAP